MKTFLLFPLLLLALACHSKKDSAVTAKHARVTAPPSFPPKLEIYTYGLANFDGDRSRYRIAQQWGFSYRAIAGCEVSQELLDTANSHNAAVEEALQKTHGGGWKERFEKEVAQAYVLDTTIRTLALNNATIAAAQKTLDKEGKGLMFEPVSESRAGQGYKVQAYTYGEWNGKLAYVAQYMLDINPDAQTAEVVSEEKGLFRSLE